MKKVKSTQYEQTESALLGSLKIKSKHKP